MRTRLEHGVFMLSDEESNHTEMAKLYFVEELKLDPEDVPEASRNLLGAFEVLYRIDERLKKEKI